MKKPSTIGKKHVEDVGRALNQLLKKQPINDFSDPVIKTVNYITSLFPKVQSVSTKYEQMNPDEHADLTLVVKNGKRINVELFLIKGKATIQPKNLGAKSFLEKYFKSKELQVVFNEYMNQKYCVLQVKSL